MTKQEYTPGPWTCDKNAFGIWAPSTKGGLTKIFDIRGWGYLTGNGHGALGLSQYDATAIQHANGTLAAAAPDLLAALKKVEAEYRDGYGLKCINEVRAAIAKVRGE